MENLPFDSLCEMFKPMADYFVALVGLWFSACTVAPPLGVWFRKKARIMRKSKWQRWAMGILMAGFFGLLVVATYRVQKIDEWRQSPNYELQKHVKNFAIDLLNFGNNYGKDSLVDRNEYPKNINNINSFREQLALEGMRSTNLENLFDIANKAHSSAQTGSNLVDIANEFSRMADKLH